MGSDGGGEQGDVRNRFLWHHVARILPATSSLSWWDGVSDKRVMWLNPEILVQYSGNEGCWLTVFFSVCLKRWLLSPLLRDCLS